MMRFKTCPKCKAQIEDVPGVPCWSCGNVEASAVKPGEQPETKRHPDLIDPNDFSDPFLVQGIAFKACGNCGAQCEPIATQCWECGTNFKDAFPSAAHPGDEGSVIADRKSVPFGEVTAKPPEEKKKPGIGNTVGKMLKGKDYDPSDEVTEEDKVKEHDMKKERRLILFHCPRCNGYFKVVFRKVQNKVKCPECKNVLMKIPYYCTRCKNTEDFPTIGEHACKTCNLIMIPDPNYE
jgi:predicted amidophosphoribosyltransferase